MSYVIKISLLTKRGRRKSSTAIDLTRSLTTKLSWTLPWMQGPIETRDTGIRLSVENVSDMYETE